MELESLNNIRQRYADLLSGDEIYNDVLTELIAKDKEDPIFKAGNLNPEDDLSFRSEQRQLSEILLDMHSINNGIVELKNTIANTLSDFQDSANSIMDSVKKQREHVDDLNVLCGNDSIYSSIIPVFASDFEETDGEIINERTVGAAAIQDTALKYDIISVSGNGYTGNSFVYNDNTFENETDDRSNIESLFDENETTIYEYSRLCTQDKTEAINGLINYDDKDVECTITLLAEKKSSSMRIDTPDPYLIIRKLETSEDGIIFMTQLDKDLRFNDVTQGYKDAEYAYGSSMLCFPYAAYIRITFASDRALNDTIAIQNEDGTISIIPAYRKKIALSGIRFYDTEYEDCVLVSKEMLNGNAVDKISLFATEYIPDHFPENEYIQYFLIVNGMEFPVVPANAGKKGTTIIKYSEESGTLEDNVELIHETIKSAVLKIVINPFQKKETPYVSNLKLCVGKNTGNIYV